MNNWSVRRLSEHALTLLEGPMEIRVQAYFRMEHSYEKLAAWSRAGAEEARVTLIESDSRFPTSHVPTHLSPTQWRIVRTNSTSEEMNEGTSRETAARLADASISRNNSARVTVAPSVHQTTFLLPLPRSRFPPRSNASGTKTKRSLSGSLLGARQTIAATDEFLRKNGFAPIRSLASRRTLWLARLAVPQPWTKLKG